MKNRYKVALYTSYTEEIKLNEDAGVIMPTSSIQSVQSIEENILSIFVYTYIDTFSSVKQFLRKNLNIDSDVWRSELARYRITNMINIKMNCMIEHGIVGVKKVGLIHYISLVVCDWVNMLLLINPLLMRSLMMNPLKMSILLMNPLMMMIYLL